MPDVSLLFFHLLSGQFYCVTFGAFRIGGDSFQKLYDTRLVEPGRSLRVTRYLDFVPMLPNKSRCVTARIVNIFRVVSAAQCSNSCALERPRSYRSVGSGIFLKNQRLYKRPHYPTNVNLQMLGQLFEDVTNGIMLWRMSILRTSALQPILAALLTLVFLFGRSRQPQHLVVSRRFPGSTAAHPTKRKLDVRAMFPPGGVGRGFSITAQLRDCCSSTWKPATGGWSRTCRKAAPTLMTSPGARTPRTTTCRKRTGEPRCSSSRC